MAKKITSSAEKLVFRYSDICNEAGIKNDISVYLARVAILEGNYQKALDLTQKAIAVGISTRGREGFNSAYRTLGDAFFGLGQVDRAKEAYGRVVSEDPGLQVFLDHEMQTVVRRRELIQEGQSMKQIALRHFV